MTAVLSRNSVGTVSKVAHHLVGDDATLCKPHGFVTGTTLLTAPSDRRVDCQKCLRVMQHMTANRREAEQTQRERIREYAEEQADRAVAETAAKRTRKPKPDPPEADPASPMYDPWAKGDPPPPVPKVRGDYQVKPAPGAQSITLGDLIALVVNAPLDPGKPLRVVGRFDQDSTLGAMVSEQGDLVIMGVD